MPLGYLLNQLLIVVVPGLLLAILLISSYRAVTTVTPEEIYDIKPLGGYTSVESSPGTGLAEPPGSEPAAAAGGLQEPPGAAATSPGPSASPVLRVTGRPEPADGFPESAGGDVRLLSEGRRAGARGR